MDDPEGQVLLEWEDVQVGSGQLFTSCFVQLLLQPLFSFLSQESGRQRKESLDVTVPPFPLQ